MNSVPGLRSWASYNLLTNSELRFHTILHIQGSYQPTGQVLGLGNITLKSEPVAETRRPGQRKQYWHILHLQFHLLQGHFWPRQLKAQGHHLIEVASGLKSRQYTTSGKLRLQLAQNQGPTWNWLELARGPFLFLRPASAGNWIYAYARRVKSHVRKLNLRPPLLLLP